MFILSTIGSLLLVIVMAARFNWDGFNKPSNGAACLVICVVSVVVCMACFVRLWNLELHQVDPNSPLTCVLGSVMLVCLYLNYKFGPQELPTLKGKSNAS